MFDLIHDKGKNVKNVKYFCKLYEIIILYLRYWKYMNPIIDDSVNNGGVWNSLLFLSRGFSHKKSSTETKIHGSITIWWLYLLNSLLVLTTKTIRRILAIRTIVDQVPIRRYSYSRAIKWYKWVVQHLSKAILSISTIMDVYVLTVRDYLSYLFL